MTRSDDFSPWTADKAAQLRQAAAELVGAVTAHAASITALDSHGQIDEVFDADQALLPALIAYSDAQFDFTGTGGNLGLLHDLADEDSDEDVPAFADQPRAAISVFQRHDYEVTDEPKVLKAGRRAYRKNWPDGGKKEAAADVTHLGRAIYLIAHADGWDALDDVPGLRSLGGTARVVDQPSPLAGDSDDWPDAEALFEIEGSTLYTQYDIYRSRPQE